MKDKDVRFLYNGEPLAFISNIAVNPVNGENAFGASDWRDVLLTVAGTGTVTVYGSAQRLPPNFSQAATLDNSYTPIAIADYSLATNTILAGSAGVTVAGAVKIVECNTNLLTWIGIVRSVDTVAVKLTVTNAQ